MKSMNRRETFQALFQGGLGAAALLTTAASEARALMAACGLTPPQTEGPFYPLDPDRAEVTDLTRVPGRVTRAQGEIVYVRGVVRDTDCRPVAGALVELWQASANGRYNHPADADNPQPLDPNFRYSGRVVTNAAGEYGFKTIVPGAYPGAPGWMRPPHLHFKINKRGFHELTTQMYFAGHQLNTPDRILRGLKPEERERVIVAFRSETGLEPGARRGSFDITLRQV